MENFVNFNLLSTNHGLKQPHPCGILKMKVDFVCLWNNYLTSDLSKKLHRKWLSEFENCELFLSNVKE